MNVIEFIRFIEIQRLYPNSPSLNLIPRDTLYAQLRYRTGTSIKTKKRKPLFGRTSSSQGCKQVQKGVIWRS